MRNGTASISTARARSRGFTLIECLIAAIVLVFITTAVVYTLSASRQNAKYIEEQRTQIALGDALVARLAAMRHDGPDGPPASDSLDAMDGYSEVVTAAQESPTGDPAVDGPVYKRIVTVRTLDEVSGNGAKAAMVTVAVTGPSNQAYLQRRVVPVSR